MILRAWALSAVLGTCLLLLAACGDKKACEASNCQGCCRSNGTCVTDTSPQACGTGGQSCVACDLGQSCVAGQCAELSAQQVCQAQGKCVKADGTCGDRCSGCCIAGDSLGTCQHTASLSRCGKGAEICGACQAGATCATVAGGFECQGGGGVIGIACGADSDCAAEPSATCHKMTAEHNASYPGGFCTRTCSQQNPCPTGNDCVDLFSYGEETLCIPQCNSSSDCRSGYTCYQVGSASQPGGCWLAPLPVADGGRPAPAGVPGSPCTEDGGQCGPPPDQEPFCNPEIYQGRKTGYVGGYCQSICDRDPEGVCGPTGVCLGIRLPGPNGAVTVNFCHARCQGPVLTGGTDGGCRPDYYCAPLFDSSGQQLSHGYCERSCNNLYTVVLSDGGQEEKPLDCLGGFACQPSGACCVTDGGTTCY